MLWSQASWATASHPWTVLSQLNSAARLRAAAPMAWRREGSHARSLQAAAKDTAGGPGAGPTRIPVVPWTIASRTPRASRATAGVPSAAASKMDIPQPS